MELLTKEQFRVLVKAMKAVYAQATFLPDADAVGVWYQLLNDLDYKTLSTAVQRHMMTSPYPPTIADLRKQKVAQVDTGWMSELAAWSLVRAAISNSAYNSEAEFAKLPPLIQKAVGNPANLREMAMMDVDTVDSVEQSHFLRAYRSTVEREQVRLTLSPAMRELSGKTDTLMIGGTE